MEIPELEKRLTRVEERVGLVAGVTEPLAGEQRGSVVAPFPRIPKEEKFDLDELRQQIQDMISDSMQNVGDYIAESYFYEHIINFFQNINNVTKLYVFFNYFIKIIQSGAGPTLFEVQSEATGDGVYNCYQQTLDATEWADTAGDDKFDDLNSTSIAVLNLLENNPASLYENGLTTGDRIAAWQFTDDENNVRWVGVPIVNSCVRRAKIQSVSSSYITVKLLNNAGTATGSDINVSPIEHLGSNSLTGDVWPDLAADDIISVFQDINGYYYTTFVFDDTTTCD